MSFNKFQQISIGLSLCLFVPLGVEATVLYLEPASGQYYQGDTFIVEAKIDTEGECINTVEANLRFSQDILEGIDFSRGNSILTIWVKRPVVEQDSGLISFTGGIPAGFCGRLPGDPGESNLLGKIIFKIQATSGKQQAKVEFLDDSQVLLNDGLGTKAKLTTKGAVFTILAEKLEKPQDQWQEELKKDNIPPEPFEIEIHQNPGIFEGKYFINFSTTDKQTGIDYYAIQEISPFWKLKPTPKWIAAESPYLLKDQSLRSIIKVKAMDKAGNERVAEYRPEKRPFPYWIIILILIIGGVILWLLRKFRNKNAKQ
jgi:hypothetical protein